MFKKSIEAKSQQRLSGADRKKLKRTIKDRFPNASDPDLDTLIPPKVEVTVSKHPNRVLIYSLEGGLPIFFDVDSRGTTIFPTVYTLWKVPHLLPAFILRGGKVSRYVIGGEDLMFPGIYIDAEGLPEFSAGEPWAVIVPGNPAPIAVGSTCMSSSEALKAGLRGKALKISHHYRDALWSNHVLPCRPPGTVLDIKKSSHKKLSKWLQSKSSEGLISSKEDKHKKEVTILAVNRKHPDYTSFKPEKKQVEETEQVVVPVNENDFNRMMELVEIYKPSVHVNPIFTSVGADMRQLYSASEASEVVFGYVEKENLVKPTNKSIVVLDAILRDALFKGAIKKGSTYPSAIYKKDLAPTFINRMQAHHHVTRGKESVVRKGALKPMQIMTERRQGNKKVTKLSGMESFLIDAEPLASKLQKKFACSTSVIELPGKKGYKVLVQGGVLDVLARYLVEQYGIPKKYIEVLDKTARK